MGVLDELQKVHRLGGDTYSSAEVIGLVGRIGCRDQAAAGGNPRYCRHGRRRVERGQVPRDAGLGAQNSQR